jgi:O-methyltransferase
MTVAKVLPDSVHAREEGLDWPTSGETMMGLKRLDNLEMCTRDVVAKRVPGDLIECGAWRGGATIFMRAALQVLGDTQRVVWVADSFEGLPKPDETQYPQG